MLWLCWKLPPTVLWLACIKVGACAQPWRALRRFQLPCKDTIVVEFSEVDLDTPELSRSIPQDGILSSGAHTPAQSLWFSKQLTSRI